MTDDYNKFLAAKIERSAPTGMAMKSLYAHQCFGLPVEQIKTFDELTEDQQQSVYWHFCRQNPGNFIYAVKRSGDLVEHRERKRPEWGTI